MSQENVEIIRRMIDAFNRDDLEAAVQQVAPDFELWTSGRLVDAQPVYRGPEGFTEWWNTFHGAWESLAMTSDRLEDLGDRVLYLGGFRGKGRESGIETSVEAATITTIKDGHLVHMRSFVAWAEALEAAGLSE